MTSLDLGIYWLVEMVRGSLESPAEPVVAAAARCTAWWLLRPRCRAEAGKSGRWASTP